MNALLRVTAMPALDPGTGRSTGLYSADLTVAEIVEQILPGAPEEVLSRLRVILVAASGQAVIPRPLWHRCRPHAGTHLIIRVVPGKDALRSVLGLVVTIVSGGIAGFLAPFFGAFAGIAKFAITAALTAIGGLLINALVPPDKPEKDGDRGAYSINGWKNAASPNGPIPDIMGRVRYAPPFAASSWSEVVGDDVHTRVAFLLGYGPIDVSGIRIGETPIEKFDEVTTEIRQGSGSDEPLSLYTQQVIEEQLGAAIERPLVRNDAGQPVGDGSTELKPVSRFTARDATEVGVILYFGQGLGYIDNKARRKARSVSIRRRMRPAGAADWSMEEHFEITNKKFASFFRGFRWPLPSRGTWEVELTMLTPEVDPEKTENQLFGDCQLAAFQSFRPEYQLNVGLPMALLAMRIRATAQINGQLDNVNMIAERWAPDWTGSAWVMAKTRNPASYALLVLRGPANVFPADDDEIDWAAFQAWHGFCASKGLTYDRVHDFEATVSEALKAIGAAGRAAISHDGRRWTVVIDRPRTIAVDHFNPRNSVNFRWSTSYFERPDAFRVQFLDQTNQYEPAERIVPWPGHVGEVLVTADLPLPGITNPALIWREARRRQYEAMHRAVSYSCDQDGHIRTVTRGDLVLASRDILVRAMHSARVLSVDGPIVIVDEVLTAGAGEWAIRWRVASDADPIGTSVVRGAKLIDTTGRTSMLRLQGAGGAPQIDDLIHFGPVGQDSYRLIVASIERTGDEMATISMLPAAEIIDELTDAEVAPAWNGRVGGEVDGSLAEPAAPIVTGIFAGLAETGVANGLRLALQPGPGSAATVQTYQARHRLAGAGSWSGPASGAVGSGRVDLTGVYAAGATVDMQARAVSNTGVPGPYGPVVSRLIPVGDADAIPQPASLLVVPGWRDMGAGPVVVLAVTWSTPAYDGVLVPVVEWAAAGTSFAATQSAMLAVGGIMHEISAGLSIGASYDIRVSYLDGGNGERGPYAVELAVDTGSAIADIITADANVTLTVGSSAPVQRHTGTLTANRTITLSTTGAYVGAKFEVSRTGGSSGGVYGLSIGGLVSLDTNTWAEATFDGTGWWLSRYGPLP
jgi:hypothetical protein